jgi:hypothetical protein
MEASFKILFTLGGYYTHESLFNYPTFRPIQSGATVPLIVVQMKKYSISFLSISEGT